VETSDGIGGAVSVAAGRKCNTVRKEENNNCLVYLVWVEHGIYIK
jgi:hypothetical protein